MESIMNEMADIAQSGLPENVVKSITGNSVINGINLSDYESVKPYLFVRLSKCSRADNLEGKVPLDRVVDMTMTYHVQISEDSNAIVNYEMLEKLGVSEEQLRKDAIDNTYNVMGFELKKVSDIINAEIDSSVKDSPFVITSKNGLNGAALMVAQVPDWVEGQTFLNYALMKINDAELDEFEQAGMPDADCAVDGFYIIPSSIHEVILIPDHDQDVDLDGMKQMIIKVNDFMVNPSERLSDEPYHWNGGRGLELAETYLEEKQIDFANQFDIER